MKLPIQHRILIGDTYWDMERPVLDAHKIGERVIVVFDYMSFPKPQQAKNMSAFDLSRNLLWVAEHPTSERTDTYVKILDESPFRVLNFAHLCTLDIQTGKVLHAQPNK